MKPIIYLFALALLSISCSSNSSIENKEDLAALQNDLVDKFGSDAYYTDMSITNSEMGPVILVTETGKPELLKMESWNRHQGNWKQTSDVTLEISGNAHPTDFMFQLGKMVDFNILGKALEEAKQKVITEKNIPETKLDFIIIKAPKDGDFNSMRYFIKIEPKNGGTAFEFWYKMDGTLDKFDY